MSNRKVSPYSIACYLIALMLLPLAISVRAEVSCKKQWGPARVESLKDCQIIQGETTDPSSIHILNFHWSYQEKNIALKLQLQNPEVLSGLKLSFYKLGKIKASYTLPLYDDPQYNILQNNLETILSIPVTSLKWETPERDGEVDFDSLTIYLGTKNLSDKLFVLKIGEIIYQEKAKSGKISITFDDGYTSNLDAAKIMAPLGLKGTAYIIPEAINQVGHLTETNLKTLKQWGWSLSGHLAAPVTQIEDLEAVIIKTQKTISRFGSNESAKHFALPLGKYNEQTLNILKKHFSSVRLAGGLAETLPITDQYRLKTINITQSMQPSEVYKLCKEAIRNKDWAILMFHYLDKPEKGALSYSSENFKKLMNMLSEFKGQIQTIEKVLK
ncbi:MAG: polysaccharide deacetylase family protein [Bacteriovoracaceae bacterium]|nr:polysaccharide deacetylase family protein [Bacteriovoracaceae bacterium]